LSQCCPNYLHRSEHYVFYYRRAIPRALKAYFPNKEYATRRHLWAA